MAIRSRRIGMGMRDEEPGERDSTPRTKISAQSFSAGSKAWEGRVGADRSSPNSFGSNFTSMRDMWAGRFLNSSGSLRDRWDRNGNINDGAERQASFDSRTGAKPAAATTPVSGAQPATAATPKLKGDDYMGAPGTKRPVAAGTPGARSFSYGGSEIYTWRADQAKADGLIKPVMAAGYDPSMTGEDYGTLAVEAASKGAGSPALMSAGGASNAALMRTGNPTIVASGQPGVSTEPTVDLWTELGGLSLARPGSDPMEPLKKLLSELTGGGSVPM